VRFISKTDLLQFITIGKASSHRIRSRSRRNLVYINHI